jgi:hypothetical protein
MSILHWMTSFFSVHLDPIRSLVRVLLPWLSFIHNCPELKLSLHSSELNSSGTDLTCLRAPTATHNKFCYSLNWSKSKLKLCYDRRSVGQSVLVSRNQLGLMTRFLLLSDSCGFVDMGRSLWQENGSAVYNCCWSSPEESFSGPSPRGLMTIF